MGLSANKWKAKIVFIPMVAKQNMSWKSLIGYMKMFFTAKSWGKLHAGPVGSTLNIFRSRNDQMSVRCEHSVIYSISRQRSMSMNLM